MYLKSPLYTGYGVEHEPGEGDHDAHEDEPVVVVLVVVVHETYIK